MAPVLADSLRPTRTTSFRLVSSDADMTVADRDRTRPFLLLHGGAGVPSMTGFADLLAERTHSRVLLPTHPGFGGTAASESLATTRDLAAAYSELLTGLDLSDVTVIGNSFGGWLAMELALLENPRISGVILVDAIGVEVEDHPMTSVVGMTPADLLMLSFHDPAKAPAVAGGTGPSPDVAALVSYAGASMSDPTLLGRVAHLDLPVQVIWGASDGIVKPAYGEALAAALPVSTFTLLPATGHLPQLETPEELLGVIFDLGR